MTHSNPFEIDSYDLMFRLDSNQFTHTDIIELEKIILCMSRLRKFIEAIISQPLDNPLEPDEFEAVGQQGLAALPRERLIAVAADPDALQELRLWLFSWVPPEEASKPGAFLRGRLPLYWAKLQHQLEPTTYEPPADLRQRLEASLGVSPNQVLAERGMFQHPLEPTPMLQALGGGGSSSDLDQIVTTIHTRLTPAHFRGVRDESIAEKAMKHPIDLRCRWFADRRRLEVAFTRGYLQLTKPDSKAEARLLVPLGDETPIDGSTEKNRLIFELSEHGAEMEPSDYVLALHYHCNEFDIELIVNLNKE